MIDAKMASCNNGHSRKAIDDVFIGGWIRLIEHLLGVRVNVTILAAGRNRFFEQVSPLENVFRKKWIDMDTRMCCIS